MRARPVIPGRSYLFTRRCSERRFFLRPDRATTNAFWYCLGLAAQRHNILLHTACALSNHVHLNATDPDGVYPNFLRDFHALLARAVNALRGRWEHFWDASQSSVVLLEDEGAQLEKTIYVLTNPLDLVEHAADWPGATSLHALVSGGTVEAHRPDHFFRDGDEGGALPEKVTLVFAPPPALAHLTPDEYRKLILSRIADAETAARDERKRTGKRVIGRGAVLRQAWHESPRDEAPRRNLSPTLACADPARRAARIESHKAWHCHYLGALAAFRAGVHAVFPEGTWLMRLRAPILVGTA